MKILISVVYYPDYNANTTCCENFANHLLSSDHQVDIIAIQYRSIPFVERLNNFNIIRHSKFHSSFIDKRGISFQVKTFTNLALYTALEMSVLIKKNNTYKAYPHYMLYADFYSSTEVINRLNSLNKHYDYMFVFSSPFCGNILAHELKKANIVDNWSSIMLDAYVFNKTFETEYIDLRKKITEKIFKNADKIFTVYGIKEEYVKENYFPQFFQKMVTINIPLLKEFKIAETPKNNNPVLIYAGSFYRYIRNPEKMLDILSKIENITFKVFSCNCDDIFEEYRNRFVNNKLEKYGRILHDDCLNAINDSDILVSLGNTITNQMQSKVLEYVGMGKPILHFYFTPEDLCFRVLNHYPLCLCINLNDYNENDIQKIKQFIFENKGKHLSYEEATKNLEEFKTSNITELIMSNISKN